MKSIKMIAVLIGLLLMLGLAGVAQAQSRCATIAVSAEYGEVGDTVSLSGDAYDGDDVTVTFDGVVVATAVGDVYNEFSTSFTVPSGATEGMHQIVVTITGEGPAECPFPFTVAGVALAPSAAAPTATVTRLPSTGFLLAPAGLLIGTGLGVFLFRKRRS